MSKIVWVDAKKWSEHRMEKEIQQYARRKFSPKMDWDEMVEKQRRKRKK